MSENEMNKKYIYYNLQEAQEEIDNILKNILKDSYDNEQFYRSIQHLVHHVNIAWNARESKLEESSDPSDETITKWSQYPKDLKLI